jgi:D-serine deaminase-like pyridoxal phosphate-dependent protein
MVPALDAVAETPFLAVDRSVLARNIDEMAAAARAAGIAVRPHTKTHKSPHIARMQRDAGAAGIQVAKLGEAEVMVDAGLDDILVGYPIVGAAKLERLARLAERALTSVALDDLGVATGVAEAARRSGSTIGLYLEVDTGAHRLGVSPDEAAERAARLAELAGVEFRGIFTHEGHAYRCRPGSDEPAVIAAQVADAMRRAAGAIEAAGVPCPEVSVGATPTVRHMLREEGVTMVRPGTYVFNDLAQLELGAADADHLAAYVVATVVARPSRDRAVIDAGSKSLSSDQRPYAGGAPNYGLAIGRPGSEVVGLSEEHGMLRIESDSDVSVGDRIAILPNHICSVVNLFDELTMVEDGRLVDIWPIAARGKVR